VLILYRCCINLVSQIHNSTGLATYVFFNVKVKNLAFDTSKVITFDTSKVITNACFSMKN